MKQAIAGVAPADLEEVTVMTVYPSIARYAVGRMLGQAYSINAGVSVFTVGNLVALLSIPVALALYFYRLKPSVFGISLHGVFYTITNRRIMERRNEIRGGDGFPYMRFLFGVETKSVMLDRFDSIEVVRRPGQAWFDAGDLVFRQGQTETFRLEGVSRPEAFRATCMKSRMSYVGVQEALKQQLATA
ncbi:MAG: PH domain-containing protein [Planctomycetales bacterium]|nr:PH domain-containing protein [Planctomycetales bacterium]